MGRWSGRLTLIPVKGIGYVVDHVTLVLCRDLMFLKSEDVSHAPLRRAFASQLIGGTTRFVAFVSPLTIDFSGCTDRSHSACSAEQSVRTTVPR